jgi:hypothetical protein
MKLFTREELLPLARSHPEVLVDIILALQERLSALELEANDSDFVGDARLADIRDNVELAAGIA